MFRELDRVGVRITHVSDKVLEVDIKMLTMKQVVRAGLLVLAVAGCGSQTGVAQDPAVSSEPEATSVPPVAGEYFTGPGGVQCLEDAFSEDSPYQGPSSGATLDEALATFRESSVLFDFQPELSNSEPEVEVESDEFTKVVYRRADGSIALNVELDLLTEVWLVRTLHSC